ncbi:hypothetical protein O2K51_14350 [Apibacter raozihei]|uniref:hypothetical protein n=1 Tax=Apibacter raozihei TaxID=2500547 RepID=UPI000FE2A56F|nr:hypothetical protein [Apibacter raozihei]
MKNTLFVTFFLLITNFFYSQLVDLAKISSGEFIDYNRIYNKNELYGYIYFFDQGLIDKETLQIEYILFDKNFNKLSTNTFTSKKYFENMKTRFICGISDPDELEISIIYSGKENGIYHFFRTNFEISLSTNKISPKYYCINEQLKEIPESFSEYKKSFTKENKPCYIQYFPKLNSYSIKDDIFEDVGSETYLKFFNDKNEQLWIYEYNSNASKQNYNKSYVRFSTEHYLYMLEKKYINEVPEEHKISVLDIMTGNKKNEYVIENSQSEYNFENNFDKINNHIYITGVYSKYKKNKKFNFFESIDLDNLGYYKIVLDSLGNEISKNYILWEELQGSLDIEKNGIVDKKFILTPVTHFIFKDGSISFLVQKYRPYKNGVLIPIIGIGDIILSSTEKETLNSDFVLISMDKDFKLKNINTIKVDLVKGFNVYNTFLFSQYIKDKTEAFFFIKNYIKSEKKWYLNIYKISNGELKEEIIPLHSEKDNYEIIPMQAKEGYIILREYNEKEKYNQIRLEKLN